MESTIASPPKQVGVPKISIGITGKTPAATVAEIAPLCESLGFHALWVNDVPGGDSLLALRTAASVTSKLFLASGVIPVDRRPPASLDLAGLPADRTVLGIGSGQVAKPLGMMRAAIAELQAVTGVKIVLGALGPKMRRLAAETADGVLLNWLTASAAITATAEQARMARAAGREPAATPVALYVRTITASAATETLRREAERYAHVPTYAANFERLGFGALDATIAEQKGLAKYHSVGVAHEVVIRVITQNNSLPELQRSLQTISEWVADEY